ncbi:hypothetical protein E2C01_066186 [Portunus trituberculatus]|uniref:Uncharacterized protein n=1 Tax=Portunus trituberculatus TaxID=210409 RepID=A0A5B7HQD0_PORTR|nr:hypothetical protein [Portunus trituberculatus]
MGPGSTALPPATALAASPSPTSGKHDTRAAEDDTHDDCPFRQLLSVRPASCTLLPRTSGGMGRGGRLSDTRGGGKSVRFADTVTGSDGLPVTPGTHRKGDATTPYKNGVVNTGKFYRRSDGRFVTRGGSRRPATAKERVTPSSARPQAAGQYSLGKTSQYQQQFECRKNCQFKEQVSNRPHKSVHKTWRSLASEGRPRLVGEGPRRSRIKVTGVSAPRWEHVDNKQKGDAFSAKQCPPKAGKGRDEVDEKCSAAYKNALLVGWPKFEANRKVASQRTRSLSCPQNSPVIQRPRFRTSSAPVGSTSAAISPTTTTSCSAASPRSTSAPVTRASRNVSHHSSKSNTSLCDHLASRAATRSSFSPKTWPFCSAKSQSYHGVGCR